MLDGKKMNNILYEDNHIIVVNKLPNIPVCLDSSNDLDLMSIIKKYLKDKYNKPGNVYLGLVHRLDRPVSGVMVFAKTSKAASRLSDEVRCKKFVKTYYAVICGKCKEHDVLVDKLLKDPKTNITRVDKNGKNSILEYDLIDYKDNLSLVKINLKTGRSHQIRVQFSSRNLPLYGDMKYNSDAIKGNICLVAKELSFIHPTTKELLTFAVDLPSTYPWSIFKVD